MSKFSSLLLNELCPMFFASLRCNAYENRYDSPLMKENLIKNGKIVWKHGPYFSYFCLNLNFLGWLCRKYISQNQVPSTSPGMFSWKFDFVSFSKASKCFWPWHFQNLVRGPENGCMQ